MNVSWKAWNWLAASVEKRSPRLSDATTKPPAATYRSASEPRTGSSKRSTPSPRISEIWTYPIAT